MFAGDTSWVLACADSDTCLLAPSGEAVNDFEQHVNFLRSNGNMFSSHRTSGHIPVSLAIEQSCFVSC